MKKLRFKPRATFNADLKRLASLDKSIIDEVREYERTNDNNY